MAVHFLKRYISQRAYGKTSEQIHFEREENVCHPDNFSFYYLTYTLSAQKIQHIGNKYLANFRKTMLKEQKSKNLIKRFIKNRQLNINVLEVQRYHMILTFSKLSSVLSNT